MAACRKLLEHLGAFDGVEMLRLKDEIRDRILLQRRNLKERILSCQKQLEEEYSTPDGRPSHPEPPKKRNNPRSSAATRRGRWR